MKGIFTLLIAALAFTSLNAQSTLTRTRIVNDRADFFKVMLTNTTNVAELTELQSILKNERNIIFTWKDLKIGRDGRLSSLTIDIKDKDGFEGSTTLSKFGDHQGLAFYRDYSPKATIPFWIGEEF